MGSEKNVWDKSFRIIAHVDMDAFFASVEVLDYPQFKGKPLVVGGESMRGVVSAASYEARSYGIGSAMPIFQAKILCPELVIRPVRMKRYTEISRRIMRILRSYSPLVQQVSVDEAYVDLTGTELITGSPRMAARSIKKKISEKTFLTCSIGVSTSKLAAKIASDIEKPDGLTIVSPSMVKDFLESRPIGEITGVGAKSERALLDIGVKYLGDILKLSPSLLREKFGKTGVRLIKIADGDNMSPVEPWTEPKSISNERTLSRDTKDPGIIEKNLLMLANKVARRLRKRGLAGRTVTLKLKDSDFKQITRSVTLQRGTQLARVMLKEAKSLLPEPIPLAGVRLIGVGLSNLEPAGHREQISLFETGESKEEKWERAEKAIDDILNRFGEGALGPGSLLE